MSARLLKADEIEVRVNQINEKGCSLLLYLDARCAMKILDETYGENYWQRHHEVINGNLYCTLSIYNKEIGQWISKQDVGVESYSEKEKGQASDAFKRACINMGVGRELYTAPFIWINLQKDEVVNKNGKLSLSYKTHFSVKEIAYNKEHKISKIVIQDTLGNTRFTYNSAPEKVKSEQQKATEQPTQKEEIGELNSAQIESLLEIATKAGYDSSKVEKQLSKRFKHENLTQLTKREYKEAWDGFLNIIRHNAMQNTKSSVI